MWQPIPFDPIIRSDSTNKLHKKVNAKEVKGTSVSSNDSESDYERAEKDIFTAIEHAEKAVEGIVRDEVDLLFGTSANLPFGRRGSTSTDEKKKKMHNTSSTTTSRPRKPSEAKKNKKVTKDNELNKRGHVKGGYMDLLDTYEEDFHCQYGF